MKKEYVLKLGYCQFPGRRILYFGFFQVQLIGISRIIKVKAYLGTGLPKLKH